MVYQIEITTRCNFDCWYCAGRYMPQKDMEWDLFTKIVESIPRDQRSIVMLQGEGEPLMHKRFWDMVSAVKACGNLPSITTNLGYKMDSRLFSEFEHIYVSIDDVRPDMSELVGRHDINRVVKNLRELVQTKGPRYVTISCVDLGQDCTGVENLAKELGVTVRIQKLSTKADYVKNYRSRFGELKCEPTKYECPIIKYNEIKFWNIDGVEMPCCFIKDANLFESTECIEETLSRKEVPACCIGCQFLE